MKKIKDLRTEKNSSLDIWIQFLIIKNFEAIKELDIDELLRIRLHLLNGEITLNYGLLDGSYRLRNKNERSCNGYIYNPNYLNGYFGLKELLLDDIFLVARIHRIYDLKEEDLQSKYFGYSCDSSKYELNGKITILQALRNQFEERYEVSLKDLNYYLDVDLQHRDLQKQQMVKIKNILLMGL